jgi:hypothetical protein
MHGLKNRFTLRENKISKAKVAESFPKLLNNTGTYLLKKLDNTKEDEGNLFKHIL